MQHCLAVSSILAELSLDAPTIAAGLLHDVLEDTPYTRDQMEKEFGKEVLSLVEGVTKLGQFDNLNSQVARTYDERELESLRKMFLAMVDDPRVVLIKLADRLHNMRTLGVLPEDRQQRIARETLEIFAPLANRLGIWQIKWELEDLGFRYLYPDKYKEIAQLIDERRPDREEYINRIINKLQEALKAEGLTAEISGRPKHIYSIWKKIERKGSFDQVYDVRAVRVIVETGGAVLCGAGHRAFHVAPHQRRVRRLHRQPQRQPVSKPAHGGRGRRRPDAGSADPHARHARKRRVGHRLALAVQGRRQARSTSMKRRSPGCVR